MMYDLPNFICSIYCESAKGRKALAEYIRKNVFQLLSRVVRF